MNRKPTKHDAKSEDGGGWFAELESKNKLELNVKLQKKSQKQSDALIWLKK